MVGKTLVVIGLVAILAVLVVGVISMFSGGEFNRKYGNKLMQLRVLLQFGVLVLLGVLYWLSQK